MPGSSEVHTNTPSAATSGATKRDEALVLLDYHGDVARLTLNAPHRLNALSAALEEALMSRLEQLREGGIARALVLTGAGKAFCAGVDLASLDLGSGAPVGESLARGLEERSNRLVEMLATMPMPVVSALNGPCVGGGIGLALAADICIAARSAYFYLPFMPRLGIVPDLGSSWFLQRSLGRSRTIALTLLDERLSAEQASQWGLIWQTVDDAELRTRAIDLAQRLACLPAHAAREVRAIFDAGSVPDLATQMKAEAERQRVLTDRPSFGEGVAAFLAKRAPDFSRQ